MQQQNRIRSGFNFLSPFYDFASCILTGNKIQQSQTWLLSKPVKFSSVLILGGGTGNILIKLMENNPDGNYCYVDISNKMVASAKKKMTKNFPKKSNSVQFICGSYTDIPPDEKFDLIITAYVLDCFSEKETPIVLNALHQHLNKNGSWMFADFNVSEKRGFKLFSLLTIRILYWIFKILCGLEAKKLPDFKKEFTKLGYTIACEKYFLQELLVARVYKN